MSDFSEWLQTEMTRRRLTLRAVADHVGVAPNTIRSWKLGKTHPDYEFIPGLARALAEDVAVVRDQAGYGDSVEPVPEPDITELKHIYLELDHPEYRRSLMLTARSLRDSHRLLV